ncbi:MAG: PBP1A family penicillin-binding protein [Bacilli bacterium]|nr:PBP1A family penicillin-binding protein [Bacilli bacterium]
MKQKLKLGFRIGLFLFLSSLIAIIGVYVYAFFSPKLELTNLGKIYLYDQNETLVFKGALNNQWVSLNDMSEHLLNAVISVEDKNFYHHHGFDYFRIGKAFVTNILKNRRQGASTISQQYIKNMFLTFDQTWHRKIEEAFLTVELEVHYSKDNILEGYLNTINYGEGNYGVGEASQYYFNKDVKDLTLEEAIMLAGIPKSPNKFNPVVDYDACLKRAKIVAKSMLENHYIDQNTYDNLFTDTVLIYGRENTNRSQMIQYYQDAVLNELKNIRGIPTSLMESGGLKIFTTLNQDAQKNMEEIILSQMEEPDLQIASVLLNPKTGGVLALTGGFDYSKSQYNRAIQSKRQVGSTMKPFLYYAALANGLTSSSTFLSSETTFVFSNNKTYSPSNYNHIYANQDITMSAALAYSDNIYAVKTHLFLGENTLVDLTKQVGIKGEVQANPSLALGTSELNMMDFATGYMTLASGGFKKEPYFIEKVEDMDGNILYQHKQKNEMILNQNYVYILNEMLTNTTNSSFNSYTTPTALSLASKMSRKYALKTGTTNTDCWSVGYTPDALGLVWVGKDDSSEVGSIASRISKNVWLETIEKYLEKKEANWYETPHNVIGLVRDAVTGKEDYNSKNSTIFYYEKGTELTSIPIHKEE